MSKVLDVSLVIFAEDDISINDLIDNLHDEIATIEGVRTVCDVDIVQQE